jgi:methionyl-tRNA synthetase
VHVLPTLHVITVVSAPTLRPLRFHAVLFPCFLLCLQLPLPKTILAHGHWTVEGMKMSKSRGNVANPFAALDTYGADGVRYFLMRAGGNLRFDSGTRL